MLLPPVVTPSVPLGWLDEEKDHAAKAGECEEAGHDPFQVSYGHTASLNEQGQRSTEACWLKRETAFEV